MASKNYLSYIHFILFIFLAAVFFYALIELVDKNISSYIPLYIRLISLSVSLLLVYLAGLKLKKHKFLRNKSYPLVNIFILPLLLFFIMVNLNVNLNILRLLITLAWIFAAYFYISNYNNNFDSDYKKKLVYPDNLSLIELIILTTYYFILLFIAIGSSWASLLFIIFFIYFYIYLRYENFKTRLEDSKILIIIMGIFILLVCSLSYLPRPLLTFNICFFVFILIYFYLLNLKSK